MERRSLNNIVYILWVTVLLVIGNMILPASAAAQTTLYSQVSDRLTTAFYFNSSTVNFTQGFATYDDFVLADTAYVNQFTWRGTFVDVSNLNNNPVQANAVSWHIFIDPNVTIGNTPYPTAIGRYEVILPAASVTTTFVGTTTYFGHTINVYDFTANLPAAFTASAGIRYWFSPVAIQPNANTVFGWLSGGNGVSGFNSSQQYFWSADGFHDSYVAQRNNETFTVCGTIATHKSVLLVHGTFSDSTTWVDMKSSLENHGRVVEAMDFPSEPETLSNVASIELQAEALARRIRELKGRSGAQLTDLVCHSMGGLAARYYMEHPELWQLKDGTGNSISGVDKLILLGTPNWGTDAPLLDPIGSVTLARLIGGDWVQNGNTFNRVGVDRFDSWSSAVREQLAEWQPAPTKLSTGYTYANGLKLSKWTIINNGIVSPIKTPSYDIATTAQIYLLRDPPDAQAVSDVVAAFPSKVNLRTRSMKGIDYYTKATSVQNGLVVWPINAGNGIHGVDWHYVSPFLRDLNKSPNILGVRIYILAGKKPVFIQGAKAWELDLSVFGPTQIYGPFNSDINNNGIENDGVVPLNSVFGANPITRQLLYPLAKTATIDTYHADLTQNRDVIQQVIVWLDE